MPTLSPAKGNLPAAKGSQASSSFSFSSSSSEEKENINNNQKFKEAKEAYKKATGIGADGANATDRFDTQIREESDFVDLLKAIKNYEIMLKATPWRDPKQSFSTFLGTKLSGFFWRDFIEYTLPPNEPPERARFAVADV